MNAFGLGIYPLEISSFYAMLIRTFETIQTNGRSFTYFAWKNGNSFSEVRLFPAELSTFGNRNGAVDFV
jgi:hypothetical protein